MLNYVAESLRGSFA